MRLFISLSLVAVLAVIALTACNSTDGSGARNSAAKPQITTITNTQQPAAKTTPGDGVRRMTVAELKAEVDKGATVIVDVRSKEQYKTDHIKGAVNIPGNEIVTRFGELPRDKMIVTYCS
jgi:3-mercaptopyruvate sulfurtransferase SseA